MTSRVFLFLFFLVSSSHSKQVHLSLGSEITRIIPDQAGGFFLAGLADDAAQLGLEAKAEPLSFVAHLDGNLKIKHLKTFPRTFISPARLAKSPKGLLVGGTHKRPDDAWKKSNAVVMALSPDLQSILWERIGGPNQDKVTGLAVSKTGVPFFTGGTRGRNMAAYVMKCAADGSDLLWTEAHRDWCLDLHHNDPQLNREGQYWHYYKIDKDNGGHDYDGEGKWGKVRFYLKGMRIGGQTLILPDGDLVVSGTNQYDFREGKNKSFPAFDYFLARYSPGGKLRWSTNLYVPGDSVHTPDQKAIDLAYDAKNDQLLCLVKQHGSNVYRFKGDLYGDTGNLMISWVGRVSAKTGKIDKGWYFQTSRQGKYNEKGGPQSPPYPKLTGNSLKSLLVDAEGRTWLCGSAGPKMWTTANALQPWPEDQNGGSQPCLVVLEPDHKTVSYATTHPTGGTWNSLAFWDQQKAIILVGKGTPDDTKMPSTPLPSSQAGATGLLLVQERP